MASNVLKCKRRGRLEARTRPSQPGKLPNEPHLLPNRGHGDLSLTLEGGCHMVLRSDKVKIGNSGSERQGGK